MPSRDRRGWPLESAHLLLCGADDGIRTRDPNLGKVVLYQLSHVRVQRLYVITGPPGLLHPTQVLRRLPFVERPGGSTSPTALRSSSMACSNAWARSSSSGASSRQATNPTLRVPM